MEHALPKDHFSFPNRTCNISYIFIRDSTSMAVSTLVNCSYSNFETVSQHPEDGEPKQVREEMGSLSWWSGVGMRGWQPVGPQSVNAPDTVSSSHAVPAFCPFDQLNGGSRRKTRRERERERARDRDRDRDRDIDRFR